MSDKRDEFWEAYRDPRWQRKRLEIMKSAGFVCEECGDSESTLNIHHRHYRKGAKPWEYEDHEFRCLCEGCHTVIHMLLACLKELMGNLDLLQLLTLAGFACGLRLQKIAVNKGPSAAVPIAMEFEDERFSFASGLLASYFDSGGDHVLAELDDAHNIDHYTLCRLARELQEARTAKG